MKTSKSEVPTPGGHVTYWATDYCLAMDFIEGDWGGLGEELEKNLIENYRDSRKEEKNEDKA